MLSSISTGALAERASNSQIPPWIELPLDVWELIGSHLGARDLARASTIIKVLCGLEPLALNLRHTLTTNNKIGELVWGLKRTRRVLSAVIGVGPYNNLFECPKELLHIRSFPCIQELSLVVRSHSHGLPQLQKIPSLLRSILLARMPQLQVLELKAHVSLPLPIMPRLRHLTIKAYGFSFERAVEFGAAFPALQTLHAEVITPSKSYPGYGPYVVGMDLRTSVALQAVCLVGMIPDGVLLPPAAKLTINIKVRRIRNNRIFAHGLRLSGLAQVRTLKYQVDFRMLSALSLHELKNDGESDVNIHLGDNASELRFLSVTCSSKHLSLTISLPRLITLVVHAVGCLELQCDDVKMNAARFDVVSVQWKLSNTMRTFEDALRAHCQKKIFGGLLGDPNWPDLNPRRFLGTRQIEISGGSGEMNHLHPCTVASAACGACLEHCCPFKYPVPRP